MLLDDVKEYDAIWNKVNDVLKFNPSCSYRGHSMDAELPFEIDLPYSVYSIENMTEEQVDKMDELIRNCLIICTDKRKEWYALDWQHSAFKFYPDNIEEQKSIRVDNKNYFGGGYNAYFPPFYPDGDYYFFIDEDFENGYLGHPWRREVWLFGCRLQKEFGKIYKELGWEMVN